MACRTSTALPAGWPHSSHAGQVRIPAGTFVLGSDAGYADERPPQARRITGFWLDRTEVTNAQFAAFVAATHHVTDAEKAGASAVFAIPTSAELAARPLAWWRWVRGADWRHPDGPGSSIEGKGHYPVVHVTLADAQAYAHWLGRDLPTEAQWEYAAKAGRHDGALDAAPRTSSGKPAANYWQGNFPILDTAEDGFKGLAPVGCYAPNAWGIHDMIGNVWEWTRDAYEGPRQPHANGDPGLLKVSSPSRQARMVIKGGSFLCSPDYCVRYRASARESQEPEVATSHVGFRTVSRF